LRSMTAVPFVVNLTATINPFWVDGLVRVRTRSDSDGIEHSILSDRSPAPSLPVLTRYTFVVTSAHSRWSSGSYAYKSDCRDHNSPFWIARSFIVGSASTRIIGHLVYSFDAPAVDAFARGRDADESASQHQRAQRNRSDHAGVDTRCVHDSRG